MKQKKIVISLLLVFALLLGGASVLYNKLGKEFEPEQIVVQKTQSAGETENVTEEEDAQSEGLTYAPDFTVYDRDGKEVKLSDYIGKPIVLNFWASWCGPCQSEMPDFHETYQESGEEIHFLMINMTDGARETKDSASDFIAERGYEFPIFFDTTGEAAVNYGAYSLPITYFINADGYVIAQATGAINGETLQKGIEMIS